MEKKVYQNRSRQRDDSFRIASSRTRRKEYGSGWLKAWKNYHKRHPKAVAFVLRGDSYMTSPIPEAEAKRLNVYQIFGWNDSVIDYMKFVLEKLRG